MITRTAFVAVYRQALASQWQWACDPEALAGYMIRVDLALDGSDTSWQATGYTLAQVCAMYGLAPNLEALRALPV